MTANLRTIRSIPLALAGDCPPAFEVRGEAYMTKSGFERMNAERGERGEPLFANPRNAAAGAVRQLDPSVTAQRPLSVYVYQLGWSDGPAPSSHFERLEWAARARLPRERRRAPPRHPRRSARARALVGRAAGAARLPTSTAWW